MTNPSGANPNGPNITNLTNNPNRPPANPIGGPPPPMDDKAVRLECVKQAVLLKVASGEVVAVARSLSNFVISG